VQTPQYGTKAAQLSPTIAGEEIALPLIRARQPLIQTFLSHGQKDDLAEHADELVVVFVMNTNEMESHRINTVTGRSRAPRKRLRRLASAKKRGLGRWPGRGLLRSRT
jgi:hypothetical protein